ncbi:MAG: signal recognition particle protein [Verrucomicrobiota bacterium]|nr:signal recognition particle protein [Verrucomicrobiota bacterium]
MFERLTDGFQGALQRIQGKAFLTEKNIEDTMRDIRIALLEADVNYKIVKEFVSIARERCLGKKVLKSIKPGEQTVKVVNDLLTEMMGEENVELNLSSSPSVIMVVGLHGSGKTTTSAKLAKLLTKEGKKVMLAAVDVHRPAAIDQLEFLGNDLNLPVYSDRNEKNVTKIAKAAFQQAKYEKQDVLIIDTAGRHQIDNDLVGELVSIRKKVSPDEILLVADSALGQEAVSVSSHFHEALNITGIILTKLDGDARGGAALSMRKVTGQPVKFAGVGEKISDLEPFYPDRMASRILGMGDVVSLVERTSEEISEKEAEKLEEKMRKNTFDFNDFLKQLKLMRKLGGMGFILDMIPGGRKLKKNIDIDETQLKSIEAIICSMSAEEKIKPNLINKSRCNRIAKGSGTKLLDVKKLLERFLMMKKMMSKFSKMGIGSKGGIPDIENMLSGGGMPGGIPGMAGGMPGMSGGMPGMSGGMPMAAGSSATKSKKISTSARKQARKKAKKARRKNR